MNTTPSYEVPEILPGDLIECLETGGKGIICEVSDLPTHPTQWSIATLPGARIKCAWWKRGEFRVVEKGPAHRYWAEALQEQKKQDERRDQEKDLDWVIANWAEVSASPSLTVVSTLLKALNCWPDCAGLLLRGEIGIAAAVKFDLYARVEPSITLAMTQTNPKQALADVGVALRTTPRTGS